MLMQNKAKIHEFCNTPDQASKTMYRLVLEGFWLDYNSDPGIIYVYEGKKHMGQIILEYMKGVK